MLKEILIELATDYVRFSRRRIDMPGTKGQVAADAAQLLDDVVTGEGHTTLHNLVVDARIHGDPSAVELLQRLGK